MNYPLRPIKDIHSYCQDHFLDCFPDLPSYQAFNYRLNRMGEVFPTLLEEILLNGQQQGIDFDISLIDSMPIIMANNKRSSTAKVACEFCNKGKCASKNMYYYGAKLHLMGFRRPGSIPYPEYIGLTPASDNDLTAFRTIAPLMKDRKIFADKIYADTMLNQLLEQEQNASVLTPIKKKKGQEELEAWAKFFSTAVSKVRQPIESFFNWIEEKTEIQKASKVRSFKGLNVHVFGRLAAACLLIAFPFFNS